MFGYSIRYYKYQDEFLRLLLQVYAPHVKAVVATYWKWNSDESILGETEVNFCGKTTITEQGTHDFFGEHSGYVWDKIYLLPIYFASYGPVTKNAGELGTEKEYEATFTIPSVYGLKPSEADFIFFNSEVQMEDRVTPMFRITNIEISHFGTHKFWQLKARMDYATMTMLDDQVVNNYMFVEPEKKIYSLDDAELMLQSVQNIRDLDNTYKDFYKNKFNLYYYNEE